MKHIFLLIISTLSCYTGWTQTVASYSFSRTTGTFSDISGTATSTTTISSDDAVLTNIPLGFTFSYCGTNYTQVSANSNGWLSLANTTLAANPSYVNQTSSFSSLSNGQGFLMAWWDDLTGSGYTAYRQTTGSAPNRVFTFQWGGVATGARWQRLSTNRRLVFQVKLYETSNKIEFVYGGQAGSDGMTATIGVANSTSDYQVLPSLASTTTSSSTFTTDLDGSPADGTILSWFPCVDPPAGTGVTNLCIGGTQTISNSTSGGTWASSSTGIATVNSVTGLVSAVAAGTARITYTVPGGCYSTKTITVNAKPSISSVTPSSPSVCTDATLTLTAGSVTTTNAGALVSYNWSGPAAYSATTSDNSASLVPASTAASGSYSVTVSYANPGCTTSPAAVTSVTVNPTPVISGPSFACVASNVALTAVPSGGTWTSAAPSVASVGLGSGSVLGVVSGTTTITYSSLTNCIATRQITVNPLPVATVTPTGATVCLGNNASFSISSPAAQTTLLNQDFNGALTGWAVTAGGGVPAANQWQLTSSPGLSTIPVSGDGSQFLQAKSSDYAGATTTTITSPSFSTNGGLGSVSLSFNQTLYSFDPDVAASIEYSINGGAWTLITNQVTGPTVIINDPGSWSAATPEFNMTLPGALIGQNDVKLRWVYNAQSLFWAIDNITVTGTMPPSTFGWTGPAGLSCTNCANPTITPTAAGNNTYTVTTTNSSGCTLNTPVSVSVNPLPAAISGNLNVCVGVTQPLTSSPGGVWESSDVTKATIGSGTGALTGVAVGTSDITFTSSATGCRTFATTTVLPAPADITPATAAVCHGSSITLSNTATGGVWSSANTSIAAVDASGNVNGVSPGVTNITYTVPSGCVAVRAVTVNALPAAITGTNVVCVGASTLFSDSDPFGTWSSNNASLATVDASGNVTGVVAGNTVITYTLPTGCSAIKSIVVNAQPAPISGPSSVCLGGVAVLSNVTPDGTWSSSAAAIAAINSSGIVTTGAFPGNVNIYYTHTVSGCVRTLAFTVDPIPAISGGQNVCKDGTVALSSNVPGGTWSSASVAIASVDVTTGVVTGMATGNTRITYTSPAGCFNTYTMTVNPLPGAISGSSTVCLGANITLSNATPGGVWNSSTSSVATISGTGVISPVSVGTATISYSIISSGCFVTRSISVNPLPEAITGTTTVCAGVNTLLSSATPGGTWGSSNTSVMSINSASGAATGVNSGIATITYTIPTGCRITTGVVVNSAPAPISGSQTVCQNNTTTLVSTTPSGVWSSADGAIATVSSDGDVLGVTPGATDIIYTLVNGCSRSYTVSVNALPGVITGNTQICAGSSSLLSSADAGGVWSTSNPSIASVNTSGNVTGGIPGGATITYSLITGCLRTQAVVVNPLPGAITGTASVCQDLTSDLNNSSAGGAWSSASDATATVDVTTGLVTGINAGITNISYTLASGCSRSRAFTVNATPAAIGGTLTACPGTTSLLTSSPVNGSWTSVSPSVANVNSAGLVTGTAAGVANISYTLPSGCRTGAVFTVNPLPSSITGTRNTCIGSTTILSNSTPGGSWTTGNTLIADADMTTGVVTGNAAGVTSVTYTLPTGCMRAANFTVNDLPAAIDGPLSTCVGSSVTLTNATNGGSWVSANSSIASVNASGVLTGVSFGAVNISYILPTGCRATRAIAVYGLPEDIAGVDAVCKDQQTLFTNATSGGTWSVDNMTVVSINGAGLLTGLNAGNAIVKYTSADGCAKTKAIVVNPLPAAVVGNINICQGSATVLSNSTSGGSWSSSNTAVATVNAAGVATGTGVGFSVINYTLPTGCSSNATLVVNALPEPITGIASVCAGGTANLETNTVGGTWSSSNAVVNITPAGMVTGIAAGTSIISYTNDNGCKRIRVFTVNALPGLITGTASVCPGLTTTLGNDVTGGTWTSDNTAIASIDAVTGVVTAIGADGVAGITYTLSTGCIRSKQLTVYPSVDAVAGITQVCKGLTTTLSNTTTGGVWVSSNTTAATVDALSGVVSGVAAGSSAIAYVMPTGCKSTATVLVNPLPENIAGPATVCEGSVTMLTDASVGGSWSSSDDMVATVSGVGSLSGVTTGAATITYTLPTGCMTTTGIIVNAQPAVQNVTGGGSYCAGGAGIAIGVDASQAGTIYKLMNGSATPVLSLVGSGASVNFGNQLVAGDYTVVATSLQGCSIAMSGTASVVITPLMTPVVSLASDNGEVVCSGTTVTYTATGTDGGTAPTYAWSVNGTVVAATGDYSYVPVDGDVVSVVFTSNAACPSVASVSAATTMTVLPNLTPSVSIAVGPDDTLCQGSTAVYGAVAVNGGTMPVYTWLVNGTIVAGESSSVYAYQPNNNDVVTARLNSDYQCPVANDVSSNSITMHVDSIFTPIVEMTASPGIIVEEGTAVTFTANAIKAGAAPSYQWLVNDKIIVGATLATYTTSKLKDADSVTCLVLSSDKCNNLSINSIVMQILPVTGVTTYAIGNSDIRLTPNPNNGGFTVSGTLSVKTDETVNIEVTDMLGQVVYRGSTVARAGAVDAHIQLGNNLANGMYMLNMGVGAERKAFHFVVKQ